MAEIQAIDRDFETDSKYEPGFPEFKERIVARWEDSKYLCKQRDRLQKATSGLGQRGQAPFQLDDMPEACREFNYPNDDQHWAQVTRIVQDFFRLRLGYDWKIRSLIVSDLLAEHHGYGDRIDDLNSCPYKYVGVITKKFDAAVLSGDKDGKKQKKDADAIRKEAELAQKKNDAPIVMTEGQTSKRKEVERGRVERHWWGGRK